MFYQNKIKFNSIKKKKKYNTYHINFGSLKTKIKN